MPACGLLRRALSVVHPQGVDDGADRVVARHGGVLVCQAGDADGDGYHLFGLAVVIDHRDDKRGLGHISSMTIIFFILGSSFSSAGGLFSMGAL